MTQMTKWYNIEWRGDTDRADPLNDDISHFQPSFEGENFKQCQHSIADVVKVEVTWVRPKIYNTYHGSA